MNEKFKERLKRKAKQLVIGAVAVSAIAIPCIASAGSELGMVPTQREVSQMYKGSQCVFQRDINYTQNNMEYEAQKKRIETIVNKIAKVSGYNNMKIVWKDNVYNGYAYVENDDHKVNPVITLNPNMGKLFSDDDIALFAAHEIGHHVSNVKAFNINAEQYSLGTSQGLEALSYGFYERLADKYAVGLASKAGYSPEKARTFTKLAHYSDFNGNKDRTYYENIGVDAFPHLLQSHPSNPARIMELKDSIEEYKRDPDNYISNVKSNMELSLSGGNFGYTIKNNHVFFKDRNGAELDIVAPRRPLPAKDFSRLMKDDLLSNSLHHAKKLSKEQKEELASHRAFVKADPKSYELKVCVMELGNHIDKQIAYEEKATKDFEKLLKVTTRKQTEEIYYGMQTALDEHRNIMNDMMKKMNMYIDGDVYDQLQKVSSKTVEIYDKRAKMVQNRLRELGMDVDYRKPEHLTFENLYNNEFAQEWDRVEDPHTTEVSKAAVHRVSVPRECKDYCKVEKGSNKFERSGVLTLKGKETNNIQLQGVVGVDCTDRNGKPCSVEKCKDINFTFSVNGDFSHKKMYAAPMNKNTGKIMETWQQEVRQERNKKMEQFKNINNEITKSKTVAKTR